MCRSDTGGGSARRCDVPAHAQVLNTANRRFSRARKAAEEAVKSGTVLRYSSQVDKLEERLNVARQQLIHARAQAHWRVNTSIGGANPALPEFLLMRGVDFNKTVEAVTVMSRGYDPDQLLPVVRHDQAPEHQYARISPHGWALDANPDVLLSWSDEGGSPVAGKPAGGLWFSVVVEDDPERRTEWEHYLGQGDEFDDVEYDDESDPTGLFRKWQEESENRPEKLKHDVKLADDASVLVLDMWEDYLAAVDAVPHTYTNYFGETKKCLDFSKLGVDCVYISRTCIAVSKINTHHGFLDGDELEYWPEHEYESLDSWDVASGILMNPHAAVVSPVK